MINPRDNFLETFNSIDFEQVKSHPNILIAAHFWEEERYMAAKACYRFMREIDDLIDDHKAINKKISVDEQENFNAQVHKWVSSLNADPQPDFIDREFLNIIKKFSIPQWPFDVFARSMIFDIYHDGFPTIDSFLEYSEGASVAPASIFVHLCGLSRRNGEYYPPRFDVRAAATPCAIFSYIVHIIRDFQKDQLNNLNYFADETINKYGLSREALRKMAVGGYVSDSFRFMILEYYSLADQYRKKTSEIIRDIIPYLEPRCQLSLEIIFNLYLMVYERIDLKKGNFTQLELEPSPRDIRQRVYNTIITFEPIRYSEKEYL